MLTLQDTMDWLGIAECDTVTERILTQLINAADEDLKSKVGNYPEDSQKAKQYMKYWIFVNYADRLGELSNKENSATKQAMDNILFNLRLECDSNADNDSE
jgi:hypothetical protein